MAKVTFVCPAGHRREIAALLGVNLMKIAVTNGVDEILAECGGSAICGTCHVYVEVPMLALLPPMMRKTKRSTAPPANGCRTAGCVINSS